MLKKILFTGLLVSMLSPAIPSEAAERITFQSPYGPAQSQNRDILVPWADSFKEISKGNIEVEFFNSNGLVEGASATHAIKDGMLDIGVWSAGAMPKDNPYTFASAHLPFLSKGSQHGTDLLWANYEKFPEVRKEIDNIGVLLAQWAPATFSISSINGAVRSPADIKGKRVMLISAIDSALIEAWGGIPVYVSISDVYIGLQRGMAEAFFAPVPFQKGLKLTEIAKYITVLPSSSLTMIMSMNRELFDSLPPEEQALFTESTGKEFSKKIAKHLDNDVATSLLEFEKVGAEVIMLTPEELNSFNTGLDKLRSEYWVNYLKEIGISDSKNFMDTIYEFAESIPNPNI